MLYWYSDPHFGHDAIRGFVGRPFPSVEVQDATLIQNHNSVVRANDEVWCLGDFAYRASEQYVLDVLRQLKGRKHFIWGNHDKVLRAVLRSHPELAVSAEYYHELRWQKHLICMFHYALRTWRHDLRGSWQLYGHSHNQLPGYGKSVDVGVERWNYTPVSYEQLEAYFAAIPVGQHPQFPNYVPKSNEP